ncbi:MAG: NAD(P)H-dependent oxidoreductase [Cytophagales bacterium]|nr:NAD(P)H-dependent oxidoreductase [Cytophagales bacterium]
MKKILAFAGSNSSQSINRRLLVYALRYVRSHEVTFADIRDYPAPVFGIDHKEDHGVPETIKKLKTLFDSHDAFILAVPEHNGYMPAVLKNTLDWVSMLEKQFLGGKKVMLLSTSPGKLGGANTQAILKKLMPFWGAEIVTGYSLGNYFDQMSGEKLSKDEHEKLTKCLAKFEESLFDIPRG